MPKDEVVGLIEDFRIMHLEDLQTGSFKYNSGPGADKKQSGKGEGEGGSSKPVDAQPEIVGA